MYSITPANAAHARRKAALLRALAGIAQQGPALGTDPFGSFQAGIRGALSAGAEQEAQVQAAQQRAIQQQYMEAQMARMLRPPQEYGPSPWWLRPDLSEEDRAAGRADALYHHQQGGEIGYLMGLSPEQQAQAVALHKQMSGGESGGELGFIMAHPEALSTYQKMHPASTEGGVPAMDDATLRMFALNYAKGGGMPALGMSKESAAARMKIGAFAAHNFPALDVAANKADLQKNTRALTDLQKLYDASTAFEQTAHANADVMLETMKGIPDTGTRFGNRVRRYLASQMGSPEVSRFNTALETVKPEFARLLSAPGAAGMLTDTARKDMQHVLGGDFTKQQLVNSLNVLKRDASNRRKAYSSQIDQIRARLAWNQTGANPNMNPAGQQQNQDVEWVMDANGNLVRK